MGACKPEQAAGRAQQTLLKQQCVHWSQSGIELLIEEDDKSTSVKLEVSKQKRYKAAQTEPWGEPLQVRRRRPRLRRDSPAAVRSPAPGSP